MTDVELSAYVLRGMIASQNLLDMASLVGSDAFPTEQDSWLYSIITRIYSEQKSLPTLEQIAWFLEHDENLSQETKELIAMRAERVLTAEFDECNSTFAIHRLIDLQHRKQALELVSELQTSLEENDYPRFTELVNAGFTLRYGTDDSIMSDMEFDGGLEQRARERLLRHQENSGVLRLNLYDDSYDLDQETDGMLAIGNFVCLVGEAGIGKSTFGIHVGSEAILQGFKVLHIVREQGLNYIQAKYDARLLGIPVREVLSGQYLQNRQVLQRKAVLETQVTGLLKVASFRADEYGIADLYTILQKLKARGFVPDVIIDDYAARMMSFGKDNTERFYNAYNGLKKLAMAKPETGKPPFLVFSFLQRDTGSWGNRTISKQDVGWCRDIVKIVDGLLGMVATADEIDQQVRRLNVLKNNFGPDRSSREILTRYNGEIGLFTPYSEQGLRFRR